MAFCCLCERAVDAWLPPAHSGPPSQFLALLDTIGDDAAPQACPHCGCDARARHLWMYMAAAGLPEQLAGARILHLAPEPAIEGRLAACRPVEYVRGDLSPTRAGVQRLDAQALPFDDGRFDLIVANHVLSHVAHPERALAEFARCLAPGGLLVAQTPFAPKLKHTFELDKPQSGEFQALFYGREDRVRLFGGDVVDGFHAAGLTGVLLSHEQMLVGMDAREFGCDPLEPFFAFSKPERETAAA